MPLDDTIAILQIPFILLFSLSGFYHPIHLCFFSFSPAAGVLRKRVVFLSNGPSDGFYYVTTTLISFIKTRNGHFVCYVSEE
jgi:hypothetical protein